jgi:hypothetical protein
MPLWIAATGPARAQRSQGAYTLWLGFDKDSDAAYFPYREKQSQGDRMSRKMNRLSVRAVRFAGLLVAGLIMGSPVRADTAADNYLRCMADICGTKTRLVDIPQAENILFTKDGRLLVSGGTNVFEIVRDDTAPSGYRGVPLYDGTDNFTGMAQIGNTLYAATFGGGLYAGQLSQSPLKLQPIHDLGIGSANGMATGPDGELYIANGPLAANVKPDPKIIRLRFDARNPLSIVEQTDWLTKGLLIPNGLRRRGRTLYVTDASLYPFATGGIKSVRIRADGTPGKPQLFANVSISPLDDMGFDGPDILAANIYGGALARVGRDGLVNAKTAPGRFDYPSSVAIGRPPLFDRRIWLVTEKGPLNGDPTSTNGNALSMFRPYIPRQ